MPSVTPEVVSKMMQFHCTNKPNKVKFFEDMARLGNISFLIGTHFRSLRTLILNERLCSNDTTAFLTSHSFPIMSHLCINIPTYKSWEGTGAGLQNNGSTYTRSTCSRYRSESSQYWVTQRSAYHPPPLGSKPLY